jgi:hypothetical protein
VKPGFLPQADNTGSTYVKQSPDKPGRFSIGISGIVNLSRFSPDSIDENQNNCLSSRVDARLHGSNLPLISAVKILARQTQDWGLKISRIEL